MLYEAVIAFASLLLFVRSANENYRKLLDEMETIPKDIKDIAEQLGDEFYINPPSKVEFEKLLAETEPTIPNFDQDQFKLQSTRIENINGIYEMKKVLGAKEDNVTDRSILKQGKKLKVKPPQQKAIDRAFALMTQFVYASRYKLKHGQILREQYSYRVEYKIGYCFALMRDLRNKQMFLYTTLHYNYRAAILKQWPPTNKWMFNLYNQFDTYSYTGIQSFVQMYEKIVQLNIDLFDVAALTQRLLNHRVEAIKAEKAEIEKKRAEEAKKKAEEEKKKAEEEKKKAEEEKKKADEEKKKAEEEEKKAEEEKKKAEEAEKKPGTG